MLMTPGVTGTTNLMPIDLMIDDLVLHQVLLQALRQLHPWVRFPIGWPLGTVTHPIQIQKNTSRSLLTNQETPTLKK